MNKYFTISIFSLITTSNVLAMELPPRKNKPRYAALVALQNHTWLSLLPPELIGELNKWRHHYDLDNIEENDRDNALHFIKKINKRIIQSQYTKLKDLLKTFRPETKKILINTHTSLKNFHPNRKEYDKISSFGLALLSAQDKIVALLHKQGGEINMPVYSWPHSLFPHGTPLGLMVEKAERSFDQYISIFSYLVKHQANVNQVDFDYTPLMTACHPYFNESIIQTLMSAGADLFFENKNGETPFTRLCDINNNSDSDKLTNFLKPYVHQANLHKSNAKGYVPLYTILSYARTDHSSFTNLFYLFDCAGFDFTRSYPNGKNLLDACIFDWEYRRYAALDLLAYGAPYIKLSQAQQEKLPIHSSFLKNYLFPLFNSENEETIQIINTAISNQLNESDSSHFTPLHWAVARGNEIIVQKLLEYIPKKTTTNFKSLLWNSVKPLNVNCQDKRGYTPLILAAHLGHLSIFQALVAAGANPFACDDEGRTILDHARLQKRQNIIDEIEHTKLLERATAVETEETSQTSSFRRFA